MERMTADQSAGSKPRAPEGPVSLDRFKSVLRARGVEATARRERGRDEALVPSYEEPRHAPRPPARVERATGPGHRLPSRATRTSVRRRWRHRPRAEPAPAGPKREAGVGGRAGAVRGSVAEAGCGRLRFRGASVRSSRDERARRCLRPRAHPGGPSGADAPPGAVGESERSGPADGPSGAALMASGPSVLVRNPDREDPAPLLPTTAQDGPPPPVGHPGPEPLLVDSAPVARTIGWFHARCSCPFVRAQKYPRGGHRVKVDFSTRAP